jgi:hypothetical protein
VLLFQFIGVVLQPLVFLRFRFVVWRETGCEIGFHQAEVKGAMGRTPERLNVCPIAPHGFHGPAALGTVDREAHAFRLRLSLPPL